MYSLDYIDEIQSHVLGLITGLMISYNLNPLQVKGRYEYIQSLDPTELTSKYESPVQSELDRINSISSMSESSSWSDSEDSNDDVIYVSTRREFVNAIQAGTKICPRYSTCSDNNCKNFHIKPEHICIHNNQGAYCSVEDCSLIVIKACRKGKKCKDTDCSFRH